MWRATAATRMGPRRIRFFKVERIARRTSSDVVPVGVVGSELLVGTGFDDVDPGGHLKLSRSLQVGSIGLDELLSAIIVLWVGIEGFWAEINIISDQQSFVHQPDISDPWHVVLRVLEGTGNARACCVAVLEATEIL